MVKYLDSNTMCAHVLCQSGFCAVVVTLSLPMTSVSLRTAVVVASFAFVRKEHLLPCGSPVDGEVVPVNEPLRGWLSAAVHGRLFTALGLSSSVSFWTMTAIRCLLRVTLSTHIVL